MENGNTVWYTPLEQSCQKLQERRGLREKIEAWWQTMGWGFPPLPKHVETPAVLARQVATFRYEDAVFKLLAEQARLTPVCLEYTGDRMNSNSNYKKSLIHPKFFERFGKNGGMVVHKRKLAGIMEWVNKPLNSIVLDHGELLTDFHHGLIGKLCPGYLYGDNSQWVKNIGGAKHYYPAFLSLFLAHAVLFEDYHGGESGQALGNLTDNLFVPTFQSIKQQFGVEPIIVKMPWAPELALYPPNGLWMDNGVINKTMIKCR